jgi:hypothetical protein
MITRDFLKSVEHFATRDPADAAALVSLAEEEVFESG